MSGNGINTVRINDEVKHITELAKNAVNPRSMRAGI